MTLVNTDNEKALEFIKVSSSFVGTSISKWWQVSSIMKINVAQNDARENILIISQKFPTKVCFLWEFWIEIEQMHQGKLAMSH